MEILGLKLKRRELIIGLAGLVIGVVALLTIRFFTYAPTHSHYHANFALYINGQRQAFSDPSYYEAAGAACNLKEKMTPQERVHMHDGVNDVVHVHDQTVTWDQFFQNLGWAVDSQFIKTRDQLLVTDAAHKITFWLNGQPIDNVSNRVIPDQSKLLIDYGGTSKDSLWQEYNSIADTAAKYDNSKDPKSCGSQTTPTIHDRLIHLL